MSEPATGKPDDHVGANARTVAIARLLFLKVAVFDHAGQLGDSL